MLDHIHQSVGLIRVLTPEGPQIRAIPHTVQVDKNYSPKSVLTGMYHSGTSSWTRAVLVVLDLYFMVRQLQPWFFSRLLRPGEMEAKMGKRLDIVL